MRDALSRVLNIHKLDGPLLSLNENFVQDFETILDHISPEKVEYIYDSIIQGSNNDAKIFS